MNILILSKTDLQAAFDFSNRPAAAISKSPTQTNTSCRSAAKISQTVREQHHPIHNVGDALVEGVDSTGVHDDAVETKVERRSTRSNGAKSKEIFGGDVRAPMVWRRSRIGWHVVDPPGTVSFLEDLAQRTTKTYGILCYLARLYWDGFGCCEDFWMFV